MSMAKYYFTKKWSNKQICEDLTFFIDELKESWTMLGAESSFKSGLCPFCVYVILNYYTVM